MSVWVFSHFFTGLFAFLVLSCMNCLYILEINPLSIVSFTISPILRVVFSPVYSFLYCAKAFKFNQAPLVYFVFYFHYYSRWVIENLALIYVIKCSAYVVLKSFFVCLFVCFFLESFIVSGLTFRFLIHFEFIFVYGVRKCPNFILLHIVVVLPTPLLKILSLPYCIFLPLCQR